MTARKLLTRLRQLADEEIARQLRRFFKTGPGQYGAGDVFLGIKVTPLRELARECQDLPLPEAVTLLGSHFHEARMLALLILVRAFGRGDQEHREAIYRAYLANTARVNNWDLVDASAGPIAGAHLDDRDRQPLYALVRSDSLWERRIGIVATSHFIRRGDFVDALKLTGLLLADREDLIHKAAGWMLREVGKRDTAAVEAFLAGHYRRMPRTMLRYAIEKFPESRRQQYLRGEV